jgi:hypothetical protein
MLSVGLLVAQPARAEAPPTTPAAPAPAAPTGYPPAPEGYQYVPANSATAAVPAGLPPAPEGYQYVSTARAAQLGYEPPLELPYERGQLIPKGYRLTEEPRRGLIIGGFILSGIPYGIGALFATGANFENASGYMMVPFVGPWMTLGLRNYSCNDTNDDPSSTEDDTDNSWGCLVDSMVIMVLVMDGILQAGGGAMILTGYLAPTRKLVRKSALTWSVGPRAIGTGYGLAAMGQF